MKFAFHVAFSVALASIATASPIDRRGLLDLDLGLCAGLNLLGLVTIGVDKDGCKPSHSEENPHPGNSQICRSLRARNIEPRDLFVHCTDDDYPGYPGWFPDNSNPHAPVPPAPQQGPARLPY
ncbi:hypothetical protein EV178_003668 [Coemansia sp. RSA 1646]|nr:hypothetical protein EV178_003668 [Coemansia sp. RSA 1646]KAJ1768587.1 hypothetical protein LPJ74_004745 [Coemansia sp. RSA 1843]KAJ2088707.1 hypothetical protein IW138_003979 [Coemansia sp. RSA 986]KAJ2213674.1 hypothetical protein EV179_003674 [Coemansia sp. RSA 487]